MQSTANPTVGDVLGQIVIQIASAPFLVGLAAVCAVMAYNIFAARTSRLLLDKIHAGAHAVQDGRSGRIFYLNSHRRRIYRPDQSDSEAVKDWCGRLQDNRNAFAERRSSSSHDGFPEIHRDTHRDTHRDYDD